jgi:hypothetical protein
VKSGFKEIFAPDTLVAKSAGTHPIVNNFWLPRCLFQELITSSSITVRTGIKTVKTLNLEYRQNSMKKSTPPNFNALAKLATRFVLGFALATSAATIVHAQGQVPSGTIGSSGAGPYTYALTFSDAVGATSPVGSVWYAWVPGQFYLPGTPTSASAPAGWTATIFANSIQFIANSGAFDILAGQSLSGFSYQATFTPAQLAAAANSGVSDAYHAGLFSDGGQIFTVQILAVPEPAVPALVALGAIILWGLRRPAGLPRFSRSPVK